MTETVLLIDDDPGFRDAYRELLAQEGYTVAEAGVASKALAELRRTSARLVVLDLMLPPSGRAEEGAALAEKILAERPAAKVIVVSGAGETPLALRLVQRGVYDFLAKPVDPDVLLAVVARAAARLELEDRVAELERSLTAREGDASALLGQSPAFLEARTLCERAAPTDVPVLITGESGTGKEVFARYLHARSRRKERPFIAVNCGALAPTLLESTLFGHRRGAFTGAIKDAPGLFVEADGGTLFLDELGDMDPALQVKLLRVLETGEILPVGAARPAIVDVRIVSATHRALESMVASKTFRDDLYWRVRGIEIALPRLADRVGDLPLLAQHFLNVSRALVPRSPVTTISPGAMRRLEACDWPGNLRELRHEMQRALVMAGGRGEILEEDLSPARRGGAPAAAGSDEPAEGATLEEKIAALERREIAAALRATQGNRSQAAARLGLSRQGLLNKMDRYGLKG
ncbi:sigma-54 dependent transcriptional regulator [Sorangium sp. So ce291]|uniref:sigma-54-dependent transcriptional regulator n=1 Tax=Sorangium sp. So ce291 TaxID=3133294 RepID=UPI003F5D9228